MLGYPLATGALAFSTAYGFYGTAPSGNNFVLDDLSSVQFVRFYTLVFFSVFRRTVGRIGMFFFRLKLLATKGKLSL